MTCGPDWACQLILCDHKQAATKSWEVGGQWLWLQPPPVARQAGPLPLWRAGRHVWFCPVLMQWHQLWIQADAPILTRNLPGASTADGGAHPGLLQLWGGRRKGEDRNVLQLQGKGEKERGDGDKGMLQLRMGTKTETQGMGIVACYSSREGRRGRERCGTQEDTSTD